MRALAPLMALCVKEHDALIAEVGSAAQSLVDHRGWLNCCRTEKTLLKGIADAQTLEEYGVDYTVLTGGQLRELEPHLSEALSGAIHFRGSPTSSEPGMLTKAYADRFTHRGGRFLKGDARRLASHPSGWSLVSDKGSIEAREAVVALGPWSDEVFRPLGYQIPLGVKRGYHMHYGVKGNATLGHSVRDADGGFGLAPMSKGVRLTTGVEFADRDAPPSPVQLARDEPLVDDIDPPTARSVPGAHGSIWANSASRQSRALIAIHDTTLGPAFGGCRMYPYASEQHAMTDVLRLSRGMTYKAAICELPYGGGQSVMIADPRHDKTPALLHAMGRI